MIGNDESTKKQQQQTITSNQRQTPRIEKHIAPCACDRCARDARDRRTRRSHKDRYALRVRGCDDDDDDGDE